MFITIEGIEGAGKSLLIKKLEKNFKENGKDVIVTREPGGSSLGLKLRPLLLSEKGEKICNRAELFLFLADRVEHVEKVIKPALAEGKIVVCDRYTHSTLAYQGYARDLDIARLKEFNDFASSGLAPNISFLLDLPIEIGLKRAKKRNDATQNDEGKFEALDTSFHEKVRNGFLQMAKEEENFIVIDATKSPEDVFNSVWEKLERV